MRGWIESGFILIFDAVHLVNKTDNVLCNKNKNDKENVLIISEKGKEEVSRVDIAGTFNSKE